MRGIGGGLGVLVASAVLVACSEAGEQAVATGTAATSTPTAAPFVVASVASLTSDVWFIEDGERWARGLRGSTTGVGGPQLVVLADGSIIAALTVGYSEGPADADLGGGRLEGVGRTDIVIGRFTASGEHVWSRLFGGAGRDNLGGIDVAGDGAVVLGGTFEGTLDLDGVSLSSAGERDAFFAVLDGDGQISMARSFGETGLDSGAEVVALDDGGFVLAGSFAGAIDFGGTLLVEGDTNERNREVFLARLDGAGEVEWVVTPGASGWASALEVDAGSGDLVVAVSRRIGAGSGLVGSRLLRIAPDGEVRWVRRFDDEGAAADVNDLVLTEDGGIVVGGSFETPIDLGGGEIVPAGWGHPVIRTDPDAFVARYSSNGGYEWSRSFGGSLSERIEAVAVASEGDILASGSMLSGFELSAGLEVPVGRGGTFIARFDGDGTPLALAIPPATPTAYRLDGLIAEGGATVLVGGRFFDAVDFGFGRLRTSQWGDFFIARIDAP
ncbi:MAG: hypothetical protein R3C39_14725 [Dehalococcoidia bacterium]